MKKQLNTVLLLILTLIVVIFSVLNVDPVAINFGFKVIQVPLAIMLIVTLLIGVLMAAILSTTIILKNRNDYKKLEKKTRDLEDKYQNEKDILIQKHQEDEKKLHEEKQEKDKEIRKLERRIQNIEVGSSVNKSDERV